MALVEPNRADSSTAYPLRPGDLVGHYILEEEIGSGGAGRVFAARHHVLGYQRALKIMHLHESTRDDAVDRWRREAVLLSQIQHGNIVRVHDAGVVPGTPLFFMVMDLLTGHTLREYLRLNRSIPVAKALHYAAEISDGVQAAHELNVVHRDIKPENVFITDANEVKVLDLGTAKVQGYGVKTTDQFRVRGTIPYMAPEQCEGLSVDSRTDIYALGIVTYEMIAGRHPFIRPDDPFPSRYELVTRQLVADPEPLPYVVRGCPGYIWRVVERALRKDPAARFPTMLEFGLALREARSRALKAADPHDAAGAAAAVVQVPAARNRAPSSSAKTPVIDRGAPKAFGPRGTFKMLDASSVEPPAPKLSNGGGSPPRGATARLQTEPAAPGVTVPSTNAEVALPQRSRTRTVFGVVLGACLAMIALGLLRVIVRGDSRKEAPVPVATPENLQAPSPPTPSTPPKEREVSQAEIDAVVEDLGSAPTASQSPDASPSAKADPVAPEPKPKASPPAPTAWDDWGTKKPATKPASKPKPKRELWEPDSSPTAAGSKVRSGL
ncbi:MAG: serine/threonine-protein kinase [Polyangiaceae bacterium]